jgi:hypothetical protein
MCIDEPLVFPKFVLEEYQFNFQFNSNLTAFFSANHCLLQYIQNIFKYTYTWRTHIKELNVLSPLIFLAMCFCKNKIVFLKRNFKDYYQYGVFTLITITYLCKNRKYLEESIIFVSTSQPMNCAKSTSRVSTISPYETNTDEFHEAELRVFQVSFNISLYWKQIENNWNRLYCFTL